MQGGGQPWGGLSTGSTPCGYSTLKDFVLRYFRWVLIRLSARKHGVADADIAQAIPHCLYAGDLGSDDAPPWRVLYLGPDRAGNLLEVVVIELDDGDELAIHAMKTRKRYEPLAVDARRGDG
jgi:hypothetical protein